MSRREDPLMQWCSQPMQATGTVDAPAHEGGLYAVRTAQGSFAARRAASCLLEPQPGDRVWVAGDLEQGLYITAILARDAAAPVHLRLPPGSSFGTTAGALSLQADSLQMVSRQLSVQVESAVLCAQTVTGVGREATWSFGRVKLICELLESFADRLVQFSRWSQRTVDGIDQVRSKQIDYRADQTMQLQAANFMADASNLVKLDGEQIHLG